MITPFVEHVLQGPEGDSTLGRDLPEGLARRLQGKTTPNKSLGGLMGFLHPTHSDSKPGVFQAMNGRTTQEGKKSVRSSGSYGSPRDSDDMQTRARETLQRNVLALMRARYGDTSPKLTPQIEELARDSGVGPSTIARIVAPEIYGHHKTNVDIVERLAKALRCETYELLMERPRWTQDPSSASNNV